MVKGGAPQDPSSTFGWMSQFSSVIGVIAFLFCVVMGFWAVFSMIFGLPSPQDAFGVRRVKNCTNFVAPGQNTVNCRRIWTDRERKNSDNFEGANGKRWSNGLRN